MVNRAKAETGGVRRKRRVDITTMRNESRTNTRRMRWGMTTITNRTRMMSMREDGDNGNEED